MGAAELVEALEGIRLADRVSGTLRLGAPHPLPNSYYVTRRQSPLGRHLPVRSRELARDAETVWAHAHRRPHPSSFQPFRPCGEEARDPAANLRLLGEFPAPETCIFSETAELTPLQSLQALEVWGRNQY